MMLVTQVDGVHLADEHAFEAVDELAGGDGIVASGCGHAGDDRGKTR